MKRGNLASNKKADIPIELLIMLILDVIVFVGLLFSITRASTGAAFYEQIYAKQIALLIDSAKPGTTITLYFPDILKLAKKNKIEQELIKIISFEKENNLVKVRLSQGKAYLFHYYNDVYFDPYWEGKTLKLKFK